MKLVFGTAQLGFNYGKTNTTGKLTHKQSIKIIKYAIDNNITYFDTASEYGNAEQLLSYVNNISIVTKLAHFSVDMSKDELSENTTKSINKSCYNLNIDIIPVLLVHTYEQYKNITIWNRLIELKNNKRINKLGVSVYTVDEAIDCLKDINVEHIQLPINILNGQWNNNIFLNLLQRKNNITVHVRSIFLQGILINDIKFWPKNIDAQFYINKLEDLKNKFNFSSKTELCISYVKSLNWVNGIIIGMETIDQLKNNIDIFNKTRVLDQNELETIKNTFINTPKTLTDPRLW